MKYMSIILAIIFLILMFSYVNGVMPITKKQENCCGGPAMVR